MDINTVIEIANVGLSVVEIVALVSGVGFLASEAIGLSRLKSNSTLEAVFNLGKSIFGLFGKKG